MDVPVVMDVPNRFASPVSAQALFDCLDPTKSRLLRSKLQLSYAASMRATNTIEDLTANKDVGMLRV
jgi:hypothetical protein